MTIAIEQARACVGDVPVGAVLTLDGEQIAAAHNRKELSLDPTDHAEIIVIRESTKKLGKWRLDGATLYTTLEPCPMCAEAIIQSRVSKLVFGAYDPRSGAAGSVFNLFVSGRPYPIPEMIGGMKEEDCQSLLKEFFRGKVS
ncbi:unnamed protein product [Sphagnum balticum]